MFPCHGRFLAACFVLLFQSAVVRAAEPPAVRVVSVRRAFHNGEHNAFTDLVRFQDRIYLTFRSCPDGHMVFPTASIIILSSDNDGQDWQQVHRFSVAKRDTRDPHFLVFRDRLFVYTGSWYCGDGPPEHRDLNEHLGYAAWTADGQEWHSPVMLEGTYGHYIWRAATCSDKAYLCGRRKKEFVRIATPEDDPAVQSAILESDDGLVFRYKALFQEEFGDETAFLFEPDGALVAVSRTGGNRNSQLVRAASLDEPVTRLDLGQAIGGPLLTKWDGRYLVGGRKTSGGSPRTALHWLVGEQLHEIAELPSGGDNSYPGFVELAPGRALLSYYSSHERDDAGRPITAIYLAELEVAD
jgi:hypothetical protein